MKRLIQLVVVVTVILTACTVHCLAQVPGIPELVEENALLKQAILRLSLELNAKDAELTRIQERLTEALALYEEAELDATALRDEVKKLQARIDEVLRLYREAESDIDGLLAETRRLGDALAQRDAALEAYRRASDARAFMYFLAGSLGGAAAAVLITLIGGGQ
ncbi:MAG: hypothetical protein NUW23_00570 [Firmicutes bacterium]|nr:hypothetical protein [Bacillota bacterium]